MIALMVTLPLISILVGVGSALALWANHLETFRRDTKNNRERLDEQQRVIEEQAATIEAYRELVSTDASFSLTSPSEPLTDEVPASQSRAIQLSA